MDLDAYDESINSALSPVAPEGAKQTISMAPWRGFPTFSSAQDPSIIGSINQTLPPTVLDNEIPSSSLIASKVRKQPRVVNMSSSLEPTPWAFPAFGHEPCSGFRAYTQAIQQPPMRAPSLQMPQLANITPNLDPAQWPPAALTGPSLQLSVPRQTILRLENSITTERLAGASLESMPRQTSWSSKPVKGDWERYRPVITRLYMNRENTLEDVRTIMKRDYGFNASTKMYKERRREWRIEKNIKTEEWQAIIRKFVVRSSAGKESEIRIRNTQISASKISQYRKRFKISEEEALTFRALTPADLVCHTPLVTPPSSPRVFELPERLARLCRVWIDGSFESKAWMVSNDQLRVESRYSSRSSIYAFFNICRHAGWCLFDGETKIGFRALNLAMAQIRNVITEQDPNTLDLLYHVILKFTLDWKKPEIASMLLRCFHSLGTVILGPGHTFTQICTTLIALDITQLTHALLISFQCRFDQFGQKIGPFNNCTRSSRDLTLVWKNYTGQTTIAQTTEDLSVHLQEYEEALGPFDLRSLQVRVFLANYYLNKHQYNEALNTIQGALDRALQGCIADPDLMCQIFKTLAYIQFGLSEFELAEKNLRYAIDVAAGYPCRDSDLRLLKRLGSWLESWNRREDAAQLREQHDKILDLACVRLAEEEEKKYQ